MKFYISSRLGNHEQVRFAADLLKRAGWAHTYDWTAHLSENITNTEALKEIGQKDFDGVKDADVVIVLTPQGRGTHTELGMAIALDKRVYLCHADDAYFKCDDATSAFYWLPQVKQLTGTIEEMIQIILSENTD